MTKTMTMTCPHCGQPFTQEQRPRRVCCDCGLVIGRHHKWIVLSDGRLRHCNCTQPQSYTDESGTDWRERKRKEEAD